MSRAPTRPSWARRAAYFAAGLATPWIAWRLALTVPDDLHASRNAPILRVAIAVALPLVAWATVLAARLARGRSVCLSSYSLGMGTAVACQLLLFTLRLHALSHWD